VKVGRNDPCPCGSGLKYKNCHLARDAQGPETGLLWRRQHELNQRLPAALLRFVKDEYPPGVLDQAWREFSAEEEEEDAFDPDSPHLPVFMAWFFYHWTPGRGQPPVAAAYLGRRGRHQDPFAATYVRAALEASFSFLEILEVTPGQGFVAGDVLTGWRGPVTEKAGSETVRRGDLLFARVVRLGELAVLDGCAQLAFPPEMKLQALELRKSLEGEIGEITPRDLRDFDQDVLAAYHAAADRLLKPGLPEITNTDGDPLVFCRVAYEVPSARAAFEALRHLSRGRSEEELLAGAEFDARGELRSVELPWIAPGRKPPGPFAEGGLSLGSISIEGGRLVAEVNSERRARRFRKIAGQRLPPGSRYLSTVVEPLEAALAARQGRDSGEIDAGEDLNQRPEIQAMLRDQYAAYYRDWLDMEIPALDGRTPRQAAATREGREKVEALVRGLERHEMGPPGLSREIADQLRTALGLES
jgi:hypothetical protein